MLLVDDVFGVDPVLPDAKQSKRQYLDEDWKLTEQENISLEPFRQNVEALTGKHASEIQDAEIINSNANEEFSTLPMLALVYKFKSTYDESDLEEKIEAHKEYCREFPSIVSDEIMTTDEGQGVVTLWVGDIAKGKESLQKDVDKFVSADPFILEDIVEEWDIFPIGDVPDESLTAEEYQMYEELKAIRKQELQDILQ